MLQLNPVYLLWNRRKTLTGSPDPTRANGTNKPCIVIKRKLRSVMEFDYNRYRDPGLKTMSFGLSVRLLHCVRTVITDNLK